MKLITTSNLVAAENLPQVTLRLTKHINAMNGVLTSITKESISYTFPFGAGSLQIESYETIGQLERQLTREVENQVWGEGWENETYVDPVTEGIKERWNNTKAILASAA
jgi:hypothetical protein